MLCKTKFTRHFETFSTFFLFESELLEFSLTFFSKKFFFFSLQLIHVKMVKSESNGKVSGNARTGSLKSFEQGKLNYDQCCQLYFFKSTVGNTDNNFFKRFWSLCVISAINVKLRVSSVFYVFRLIHFLVTMI